jgi:hypothetical protein
MAKVVINTCFGGFGLSEEACKELGLPRNDRGYSYSDKRTAPELVAVVEKLGDAADGPYARLAIVDIPDGIEWDIVDYDGREHVAEAHRTWG